MPLDVNDRKNKLEFIFHLIFDLLDDNDILGGCIEAFQYFSILLQNNSSFKCEINTYWVRIF